jgi:hypothetical protein
VAELERGLLWRGASTRNQLKMKDFIPKPELIHANRITLFVNWLSTNDIK